MNRLLDVYLHDDFVGALTQDESGELEFTYDQTYLKEADFGISLSLPVEKELSRTFSNVTYKGKNVKAFFSGLLPDETVRERLAGVLGISEKNAFALLEVIGGDCAGALALYPQGQKPAGASRDIEILTDARIGEVLELIKRRPMLGGDDGYRLSLPGAQDKLAVGYKDGEIHLIKGGGPTTHILKPPIADIEDSTHNELFCMRLAKRMGIDVPEATLFYVDDTPLYLIERYDRTSGSDGRVARIHQEDFCQALGIAPELKYQREGGPDIAACRDVLAQHAARPAADHIKLINIVIFNYLIGNADAHAKNLSLLYKENKPELAPAYDLLCTAVYPDLAKKMAMKIGGKYNPYDVYRRHFYRLVPDTKAGQSAMRGQIQAMTGQIVDKALTLRDELQEEFSPSRIFEGIIQIIEDRSKRLNEDDGAAPRS
jgi:serine/threonine-protein kinase HipA